MLKAKAFFTRLAFGSHRDLKSSEDVFILEWKEWVETGQGTRSRKPLVAPHFPTSTPFLPVSPILSLNEFLYKTLLKENFVF